MSSDGSVPESSDDEGSNLEVCSCSNVNNCNDSLPCSIHGKVMLLDNDKVMVCFSCGNILIGYKCMKHHCRLCNHMLHSLHEEMWKRYPHKVIGISLSGPPRWMDCGRDFPERLECSLQRKHPAWRKKKSQILVIIRWVTLLRNVFCRDRLFAPLRTLSKTKNKTLKLSNETWELIVSYLTFNLDDNVYFSGAKATPESDLQRRIRGKRRLPRWLTAPSL